MNAHKLPNRHFSRTIIISTMNVETKTSCALQSPTPRRMSTHAAIMTGVKKWSGNSSYYSSGMIVILGESRFRRAVTNYDSTMPRWCRRDCEHVNDRTAAKGSGVRPTRHIAWQAGSVPVHIAAELRAREDSPSRLSENDVGFWKLPPTNYLSRTRQRKRTNRLIFDRNQYRELFL